MYRQFVLDGRLYVAPESVLIDVSTQARACEEWFWASAAGSLQLARTLEEILYHAHARGFVHDLEPGNDCPGCDDGRVLLREEPGCGRLWLICKCGRRFFFKSAEDRADKP